MKYKLYVSEKKLKRSQIDFTVTLVLIIYETIQWVKYVVRYRIKSMRTPIQLAKCMDKQSLPDRQTECTKAICIFKHSTEFCGFSLIAIGKHRYGYILNIIEHLSEKRH